MFFLRRAIYRMFSLLGQFTSKDLPENEALTTQISGTIAGANIGAPFASIMLANLKNWYISKFKYGESDDLDILRVEEYLWTWGRVAIVKYADELLVGGFIVRGHDLNNDPLKIHFYPINQMAKKRNRQALKDSKEPSNNKLFTVGVDAVVIQCSSAYFINTRQYFTPFIKTQRLLGDLQITYNQLLQNVILSRSVLPIPVTASNKEVEQITTSLLSGDPVIRYGMDGADARGGNNPLSRQMLEFKERADQIIKTYHQIWENIQTGLGIDTNANPEKRERQITTEIEVNNALSDGINETELQYRKRGLKMLKKVFNIDIAVELRKNDIMKERENQENKNAERQRDQRE